MKPTIWAGSEASYDEFMGFEAKFSMDKVAYARSPFDRDEGTGLDPVFGVEEDRKGLTVLEMAGETPVIKIHGSLVADYHRYHSWFPGQITSYQAVNDAFAILAETGAKNIVMDFASGGGQVRSLDTVTKSMKRAQAAGMHIHGHSDSASMSASYWIMAGCDTITGSRMAEVGNIGTMAVLRNLVDTEKNMGVKFTVFKEGEFKGIGNGYEALSERDKTEIQSNLKKANAFFLGHVSAYRGTDLTDTHAWAEGKTFYAGEAVKNGLIDRVADLEEIIGGASATNPGDKRMTGMKISAAKLAQIEAGANAEDVLTSAELKQYKADIQAAVDAKAAADQLEIDAKAAADALALEEANKDNQPKKPDVPAVTAEGGFPAELSKALVANGRLEGRIEVLEAALVKAEGAAEAAKTEASNLMVVAGHAVTKLQKALGLPMEAKASVNELLAQFNTLQDQMAATFPTTRVSIDNPKGDPEVTAESSQNYRLKSVQLQQKQSR